MRGVRPGRGLRGLRRRGLAAARRGPPPRQGAMARRRRGARAACRRDARARAGSTRGAASWRCGTSSGGAGPSRRPRTSSCSKTSRRSSAAPSCGSSTSTWPGARRRAAAAPGPRDEPRAQVGRAPAAARRAPAAGRAAAVRRGRWRRRGPRAGPAAARARGHARARVHVGARGPRAEPAAARARGHAGARGPRARRGRGGPPPRRRAGFGAAGDPRADGERAPRALPRGRWRRLARVAVVAVVARPRVARGLRAQLDVVLRRGGRGHRARGRRRAPRRRRARDVPGPVGPVPRRRAGHARRRAAKESEIPNFKGSYLGRFPLDSADFWTSDHLSERPRSVDAFLERARAEHSR